MLSVWFLPLAIALSDDNEDSLEAYLASQSALIKERATVIAQDEYAKFKSEFLASHEEQYNEWFFIRNQTDVINKWIHEVNMQMADIHLEIDEIKSEILVNERKAKDALGLSVHFESESLKNVIEKQDKQLMKDYSEFLGQHGWSIEDYEAELVTIAKLEAQIAIISNGTNLADLLADEDVISSIQDKLPRQLSLEEDELQSNDVDLSAKGLMNKLMLHSDEVDELQTLLVEKENSNLDDDSESLLAQIKRKLDSLATIENVHNAAAAFESILPLYDGLRMSQNKTRTIMSLADQITQCYRFIEPTFGMRHSWSQSERERYTEFIVLQVEAKLALESKLIAELDTGTIASFMMTTLHHHGLPIQAELKVREMLAKENEIRTIEEKLTSKRDNYQNEISSKLYDLNRVLGECVASDAYGQNVSSEEQTFAKHLIDIIGVKESELASLNATYTERYEEAVQIIASASVDNEFENQHTVDELNHLRAILISLKSTANITNIDDFFPTQVQVPEVRGITDYYYYYNTDPQPPPVNDYEGLLSELKRDHQKYFDLIGQLSPRRLQQKQREFNRLLASKVPPDTIHEILSGFGHSNFIDEISSEEITAYNENTANLVIEAEAIFEEKMATSTQLYTIDKLLRKLKYYSNDEPPEELRVQFMKATAELDRFQQKVNAAYDSLSLADNIDTVRATVQHVQNQLGSTSGYTSPADRKKKAKLKQLEKKITPQLCEKSIKAFGKEIRSYNKAKSTTEIIEFMMNRYYQDVENIKHSYDHKVKPYDSRIDEINNQLQDGSDFMREYDELAKLADEKGVITRTLKAGANYLAIGPDFDEVGDADNYQFQDCNDIRANSPDFNSRMRDIKSDTFYNGLERGKMELNLVFPPAGLGRLVVPCFTQVNARSVKLDAPTTTWSIVARGNSNYPLVPGYLGSDPSNGFFFIGADNLHFLSALTHHAERLAIKLNIAYRNGQAAQYYYPEVKIEAESTREEDTFYVNWKPHDEVHAWQHIKCNRQWSCKKQFHRVQNPFHGSMNDQRTNMLNLRNIHSIEKYEIALARYRKS